MEFPKTINIRKWVEYLGRQLTPQEINILQSVRVETKMNDDLKLLHNKCEVLNYHIPKLKEWDGNCMFESLNYHNIGDSVSSLREGLAFIMYQFKDYENFFPDQKESLSELFVLFNEIEYVHCNDKLYKYTYNIMCRDIADDQSWSKLPTQLILMVISFIFRVKIVIINNQTTWVNTINIYEEHPIEDMKTVYIGHLLESHYVPLDVNNGEDEYVPIYHKDLKRKFIKWAMLMQKHKIQRHNNNQDNMDNQNQQTK